MNDRTMPFHMKIYLVRHGHAEADSDDDERALSRRGRAAIERLSLFLGSSGVEVDDVLHSGKRRAAETAEILARSVSRTLRIEPAEGLSPDDDPRTIATRLESASGETMIIGHLPHLERLAARLLDVPTGMSSVTLTPGTVVCLARSGNEGAFGLDWLLRPELLGDPDLVA